MANFVQWRCFIGPKFLPTSHTCFYDWSVLSSGGELPDYPSATLTSTLSAGSTSASISGTSFWPSKGGFWVGPNGSGQSWEYISYPSKFSSLQRETTTGEQTGNHSAGATCRFWWPVDTNDGRLHLTEEMDDNLCTVTWRAEIGGVLIPQAAMRNHHLIVVQTRTSIGALYTNFLVGWLDQIRVNDDAKRYSEWSARIISSAEMLRRQQVNGLQVGDLDMAKKGNAQGSTPLGSPYKERNVGDYVAANPSFDAGSTIDDDEGTLWIAERYMGDYNTPAPNQDPLNYPPTKANTEVLFTQVYCNPPAGQSGGRRWIELTAISNVNVISYQIFNANGTGSSDYITINPGNMGTGDHILIVEDKDVFGSENPLHREAAIYEYPNFFANMSPASGELSIRYTPSGAPSQWLTNIKWGDSSRSQPHVDGSSPGLWSGPRIASPGQGETLRYVYADPGGTPACKDYWRVSRVQSPGYDIGTSPDQWLQIELASMGLILRDDITNTTPGTGDVLYINDASGPNTGGLASSGTLQIGSEQISYSAKHAYGVTVSARGTSGTTPAAHAAKDVVYVMDGGVATDAAPIKRIAWTRQGGTIHPNSFHLKCSNLPTGARTPDNGSDYVADYTDLAAVSSYASSTYSLNLSPAKRIKFLLMTIARMTENPGRPRVNTISAFADEAYYNPDTWLTGSQTCGDIITKLLQSGNIPDGAIIVSGYDAPAPSKTELANDDGWTLITDFCDYTGTRVVCGRDSKFTITADTAAFWESSVYSASNTWNRATASTIEQNWQSHGNVSQVSLKWQSADGSASGTVTYPETPDFLGKVLELGPLIYPNSASAQLSAMRRYIINKYPYTLHVDCADAVMDLRPGTMHLLNWQIDSSMTALSRYYIGRAVDHSIDWITDPVTNAKALVWSTSLEDIQIDRAGGF